jgi:DNA invertase Pin-like site-specific DNA recombinase
LHHRNEEIDMTVYAYIRVSTTGQTTENQRKAIVDGGYTVDKFVSEDGVSGSMKATDRPAFKKMLSRMVEGDKLIVTMVDRLGRSASDILNVVELLKTLKIKVLVLQFEGMDITGSMGKMVLTCMAAMAELERNILIERVQAGLERTKAEGTVLGPPLTVTPTVMTALVEKKAAGATLDTLAKEYGIPRNTIARNISKWKDSLDQYLLEWTVRQTQYAAKAA